jgi:subtilase family serine protease
MIASPMLSKILIMTLSIAAGERVSRKRASPIPDRLELTGSTPPNATLGSIDVALVPRDYPGLQGVIQDRSDPTSPRYAQWLTTEEVTAFVGATDEAIEKVGTWMRSVGLEPVLNNHKDILTAADAPAAKVEALLGARLHAYHDRVTSTVVHRIAGDYSIPSDIAPHVAHGPRPAIGLGTCVSSAALLTSRVPPSFRAVFPVHIRRPQLRER